MCRPYHLSFINPYFQWKKYIHVNFSISRENISQLPLMASTYVNSLIFKGFQGRGENISRSSTVVKEIYSPRLGMITKLEEKILSSVILTIVSSSVKNEKRTKLLKMAPRRNRNLILIVFYIFEHIRVCKKRIL